ncbi:hypothetical protein KCTC32516_01967 [Polaribacter huanghezhanensis]|uniref:DUF2306 domain-containing protein n=1 Tax=Polaribacter huanghezhanensis TaxID=1354726 RepID=UPI00264887F5|nr:DUF2306 domain-containing protein [Polaribacter huanghezhanensis]WKD86591.1 hypothetical protein KCTC32516_01967 [Polaribacter huanghezhanensis]
MKEKIRYWIIAVFSISIGLYPLIYLIIDMDQQGLLSSKSEIIATNFVWRIAFFTHIYFGGISLLVGWSQFSKRIRGKRLKLHRFLGKIYVITVLFSSITGFYVALFANGGIVSQLGFSSLAIGWFYTTLNAYTAIKKKNIIAHRKWMIRSYAFTLAAVTLRLWLPTLPSILGISFSEAYIIISWLCWVPNIIIAEIYIRKAIL